MIVLSTLLGLYIGYNLLLYVIALTGWHGRKANLREYQSINKVLVMISAHDEQRVLGNLLDDLNAQSYPVDVLVILDHCNDHTEAVASSYSNVTVYQRTEGVPGKQFALKDALNSDWYLSRDYDAVIFLDADNRIDTNFIMYMIFGLIEYPVIQSYLGFTSPGSFVAKGYAVNYRVLNGVLQRARQALGLTAMLGGTGWGARTSVLRQVPFDCTSVTDDLEYTVRLWIAGFKVHYFEHVEVQDEKPCRVWPSMVQRLRWMRGGFQVFFRYWKDIVMQGIINRRFSALDLGLFLLGYGFSALSFVYIGFGTLFGFFSWFWYFVYIVIYNGVYLLVDEHSKFSELLWLPYSFVISLTGLPLALVGLFTWRKVNWVRTEHFG